MMYVDDTPNTLEVPDVFNKIDVLDVTDVNDASYALDVSDVLDESDIFSVTNALDVSDIVSAADIHNVTDIMEATDTNDVIDVSKVLDVTDITVNVSDDSYDLSSTSDISKITTTEEVLKVHHQVDMEYDANGSPVLSSGPTPCPSRPPRKPPYFKQCGSTNLHDMSPFEFIQAHFHEVEAVVVPDADITDDRNHSDGDLYDASYEIDPFDIDTLGGTIQAYACMDEKVRMPKDKWFGQDQKTKDLWDQIDDKYRSAILGYTKSSIFSFIL
jgi:hypothetical protein